MTQAGGAEGTDPARPLSLPVLPPLPRPERFRQTWLHSSSERPLETSPNRRGRSSAPAQLQGHIHARETVVLRGIEAQGRRAKPKAETQPPTSSTISSTQSSIDTRRLDALEEHIDRLLYSVQRYQCHHDWRSSIRSVAPRPCACGNTAAYVSANSCRLLWS